MVLTKKLINPYLMSNSMSINASDTAWKEILETNFKDCLDYCLPNLSNLINWEKPHVA